MRHGGGLGVVDGDAHQLGAGLGELLDLDGGADDVDRVGVGHRLHAHRRVATDGDKVQAQETEAWRDLRRGMPELADWGRIPDRLQTGAPSLPRNARLGVGREGEGVVRLARARSRRLRWRGQCATPPGLAVVIRRLARLRWFSAAAPAGQHPCGWTQVAARARSWPRASPAAADWTAAAAGAGSACAAADGAGLIAGGAGCGSTTTVGWATWFAVDGGDGGKAMGWLVGASGATNDPTPARRRSGRDSGIHAESRWAATTRAPAPAAATRQVQTTGERRLAEDNFMPPAPARHVDHGLNRSTMDQLDVSDLRQTPQHGDRIDLEHAADAGSQRTGERSG